MPVDYKASQRNCFVSYHHEYDQDYMHEFRKLRKGTIVSDFSLKEDIGHQTEETIYKKIREKMRQCSVTIVLVGKRTGYRRWIDLEIWASLRPYTSPVSTLRDFNPNGLLAIYLPDTDHDVPERLQDNIDSGYAVTMHWDEIGKKLEQKIEKAYQNRTKKRHLIDNTRERKNGNNWDFLWLFKV